MINGKLKILVGMSGGVDSSTTCAILLQQNYEVVGMTLDYGKFCESADYEDSKEVCKQLGIKHHVFKCETEYEEKVVKYFVSAYTGGETPNPCANCNKYIKFPTLLEKREELGCDFLATGHYAKVVKNDHGIYELQKGIDPVKDQSYFIGQIRYEYLQYLKFPLGDKTKQQVREIAKKMNLYVADKPESQDMCLARGKDYREILRNYAEQKRGDIIHIATGKKLAEHNGIADYTQGQRKGLGIGGTAEPLFVIKIDPRTNTVYVGNESDLFKKEVYIDTLNLLAPELKRNEKYDVEVKLRSTTKTDKGKIIFGESDANIVLDTASRNVSKGQLCGLYMGERLIASGFIR
ncbi:MAG: tRNA 2-thiouridine(34) synthase MnmA [Rickettsiales bacterium]|jgi:tRNA-specific 2-thiouridylase|nr:tRNA 2-thiouridine(34) synthase MnmA [Rickettsiales bacterium]